jgi:hypothetical protein
MGGLADIGEDGGELRACMHRAPIDGGGADARREDDVETQEVSPGRRRASHASSTPRRTARRTVRRRPCSGLLGKKGSRLDHTKYGEDSET